MSKNLNRDKSNDFQLVRIRSKYHRRIKMLAAEMGMSIGELVESTVPYLEEIKREPKKLDPKIFEAFKKNTDFDKNA